MGFVLPESECREFLHQDDAEMIACTLRLLAIFTEFF